MKKFVMAAITMTALIAPKSFAYDANWQVDEAGNWSYIMTDGTKAANAWIHDNSDSQWYLLDENGIMRTGLFASSGKYYLLDTVRGTGTYGKLLKNGDSYNGISIQADTSAEYEGALSDATLAQLESQGVSKDAAPNVSNTQHISNGVVTSAESGSASSSVSSVTVNGEQFTISPWGVYGEGSVSDGSGSSSNDTYASDVDDDFEKNYNERLRKMAEELDNDPKWQEYMAGHPIDGQPWH